MVAKTSLAALLMLAAAQVQGLGNQHADTAARGPQRHKHLSSHVEHANLTTRGYQYTNKRATNFGAGESACGPSYSPDEHIVALAQNTFGFSYPSPYCNRPIVISYGGKTANAKIVDSCVRCAQFDPHALDLSTGLFEYFASLELGVINVDWSFADGSDGGDDDEKKTTSTKHTTSTRHTTSTHHTTPTSTSHSTTSTRRPTSSTHSTTSTTHSQSTTHTTVTSTSTSAGVSTTSGTTAPIDSTGNLQNIVEVILGLGDVLEAAHST